MAILYAFAAVLVVQRVKGNVRLGFTAVLVAVVAAMCFMGKPLALVGSAYIILAAYAVRSLPASVRAGVAALQQIDPSIEEASSNLGADAQLTFRRVTLPLILPALLAGLIFSFTRHMTSLSAIIFLVSPRWRIVTASILSEWEQGGVGVAAAYSTTIIVLVLIRHRRALSHCEQDFWRPGRGSVPGSVNALVDLVRSSRIWEQSYVCST